MFFFSFSSGLLLACSFKSNLYVPEWNPKQIQELSQSFSGTNKWLIFRSKSILIISIPKPQFLTQLKLLSPNCHNGGGGSLHWEKGEQLICHLFSFLFLLFPSAFPQACLFCLVHYASPVSSDVGEGRRFMGEIREVEVSDIPGAISGLFWFFLMPLLMANTQILTFFCSMGHSWRFFRDPPMLDILPAHHWRVYCFF